MEKQVIVLGSPSEKKHSVRYDAAEKDAAISAVYLMRSAFKPAKAPKKIRITVEEVE